MLFCTYLLTRKLFFLQILLTHTPSRLLPSTMLSKSLFTPALTSSSSRLWRKIGTPSSSILGGVATTTATNGTNHYNHSPQTTTTPQSSSTKWFTTSTKILDTAKFDLTGSFLVRIQPIKNSRGSLLYLVVVRVLLIFKPFASLLSSFLVVYCFLSV